MTHTKTKCNLCGKDQFRVVEEGEGPYSVLKCTCCGLVFVDPLPETSFLKTHYDESYYAEWIGSQEERRLHMWRKRLSNAEKFSTKGRLLDVGCATGTFLHLAQKKGWEVGGTEFSPYAASFAQNLLKTSIFCGPLMDAKYADAYFDLITCWHVLEHVADPMGYLKEMRRILKPTGFLVIAVPNVNDYLMKMAYIVAKRCRPKLFSQSDREVHLFHFSAHTLRLYLNRAGFRCVKMGPDSGVIEISKKVINTAGVALYHLTGLRFFNALEVHATRL